MHLYSKYMCLYCIVYIYNDYKYQTKNTKIGNGNHITQKKQPIGDKTTQNRNSFFKKSSEK